MGVILKYQVNFPENSLKVSNDATAGDYILDADITVDMQRGASGSGFEIKLLDLPEKEAKKLYKQLQGGKLGSVVVKLGYMDGKFDVVMGGLFGKVVAASEGDKLVTTISGLETGTHALRHSRFQKSLSGATNPSEAISQLLKDAKFEAGDIDRKPLFTPAEIGKKAKDVTLRGETLIEILDDLAERADAELLVCDKKVRVGKPISDDDYAPDPFSTDVNLAVFTPFVKDIPEEKGRNRLQPLPAHEAQGYRFLIAGDPKLRPAQKVFAQVDGYDKKAGVEYRVHSLVHHFSTNEGYICEGVALKVCTNGNCRRQQDAAGMPSAEAIVQSLSQRIKDEQSKRPYLEVGKIKEYKTGTVSETPHRGSVFYGQRFERTEPQPSLRAEVESQEKQLLTNTPLASPFAWHKCGLVVPVYPGMKALVGHNLGLANDGVIAGFLWSEKPAITAPENKPGDWWLCLPIDFDPSNPPTDQTKAVNDITTNTGTRVIELKGLKITVGTGKLATVGKRPIEGADDEFLIEHASGTRLRIASDGALTIDASKASLTIRGDVVIEGTLEIK